MFHHSNSDKKGSNTPTVVSETFFTELVIDEMHVKVYTKSEWKKLLKDKDID